MIGTLFLFMYWPSFNCALQTGEQRVRAIINTYFSLTGGVISTFLTSMFVNGQRLNLEDVLNATVAGGVAIGATCDTLPNMGLALLIGVIAGICSSLGFNYLNHWFQKTGFLHDTCGVANLHFIPGVIGGLASAIVAGSLKEGMLTVPLDVQYPGMAPDKENWTTMQQGGRQFGFLLITIGISLVSGYLSGLWLKLPFYKYPKRADDLFVDYTSFKLPAFSNVPLDQHMFEQKSSSEQYESGPERGKHADHVKGDWHHDSHGKPHSPHGTNRPLNKGLNTEHDQLHGEGHSGHGGQSAKGGHGGHDDREAHGGYGGREGHSRKHSQSRPAQNKSRHGDEGEHDQHQQQDLDRSRDLHRSRDVQRGGPRGDADGHSPRGHSRSPHRQEGGHGTNIEMGASQGRRNGGDSYRVNEEEHYRDGGHNDGYQPDQRVTGHNRAGNKGTYTSERSGTDTRSNAQLFRLQ
jgi:hypothetical protein